MIAIVGDIHGRFKELYDAIDRLEDKVKDEIKAVVLLGDVMPIRDKNDLFYSFLKEKYRKMELYSFREYYKKGYVPKLTYFIGGNHEPYCYLGEDKKELIENLIYLGRVGNFELNGLKFAFLSGIYSPKHYYDSKREDCKSHAVVYFNENDLQKLEKLIDEQTILLLHEHLELNPKNQKRKTPLDDMLKTHKVKAIFAGHLHVYQKYHYHGIPLIYLAKFPLENSIYIIDDERVLHSKTFK